MFKKQNGRPFKPKPKPPQRRPNGVGPAAPKPLEKELPYGLIYKLNALDSSERDEILKWLTTLHPIWEERYSQHNPPPDGQSQRRLLRPVYWLGNWQFACHDYYHPPKGIEFRCVEAEAFPPCLQKVADQMQEMARATYNPKDIPKGWHFNTCLINFYGSQLCDGKWEDTARVGEHKDFEPGPVGSFSLGDRAFFQFIKSQHRGANSDVVFQQWLDDSAFQIFAGDRFKKLLFHRVQRVERKQNRNLGPKIPDFVSRRINFTFRYVPNEHIRPLSEFPAGARADVQKYVEELGKYSPFFAELAKETFANK